MLIYRLLVLAAAVIALPLAAGRATTLTYDTPAVQIIAGQSITVGVTLSLSPSEAPLITDGNGQQYVVGSASPLLVLSLAVYQPETLDSLSLGTPDYFFAQDTSFTTASPNPVANLDVLPGDAVHLVLGTIATLTTLPSGIYTTDIGINAECISPICLGSPFLPPSYADAGVLTIDVVPEPTAAVLLLSALGGLTLTRRRCSPAFRSNLVAVATA
jgi:hypothetical protein